MSSISLPGNQKINLHGTLPVSLVNGPGKRGVIWLQGCPFDCPGCFNQEARNTGTENYVPVKALCNYFDKAEIEGITISGGEPFYQVQALNLLCEEIGLRGWTIVLYSGYTLQELLADHSFRQVLAKTDILIDGPYRQEQAPVTLWAGSGNQQVHFLSGRYREYQERITLKTRYEEIHIDAAGTVSITGF